MNHPDRFLDMIIPGVNENGLLTDVVGEDYISSPYYFKLTVLCDNHDLPLRDLLEKPITFRIGHLDSRFQTFHGLLYGLARESKTVAGMTEYTLWVHPRLRWLADKKDSYVYAVKQPQTIPEIVTEILKREGLLDYRFALVNDYPRLSLSVQYDESAFNILHRLLSQAGIYYYFERTADKETLVLTDNLLPSSIEPAQYSDDTHTAPHLFHWQARLGTSSVAIKGQAYDFRTPNTIVKSEQTLSKTAIPSEMRHGIHRHHDTPFHANTASLDAQAKPRLSASQRSTNRVQAKGTYHHWQAGTMFSLSSSTQPKLSGDYCVSHIAHVARDTAHLPSQSTTESQHYHNVFYAHPSHLSLMGQAEGHRLLPELGVKPIVIETPQLSGVYTATTTGPKGTTVYTDKYNRVKVQFDWDKHGQYDENSFAWVRVKQVSASDGFGVQVTPRVGQRVLACFNHGDPHNPMIIGMLAQDKAPFSPKSTPTQLGWQSNSLDPQANQQAIAGHQLRFDDNVKHPTVNLHSYRDMDITAHGEHKTTVGKNMTTTVTQGNYLQQTEKDLHLYSDKGIHLINGQSRISITPTDITIESDEIGFNGPKPVKPMVSTTSGPHWIQAQYLDEQQQPITHLAYTLTPHNGNAYQGHLDSDGKTIRFNHLPPGPVTIELGDKSRLQQQLTQQRQRLRRALEAILAKTKAAALRQRQAYRQDDWITRHFFHNRAVVFIEGAATGVGHVLEEVALLFKDAAQVQALDARGRYDTQMGNTQDLAKVEQAMIAKGQAQYGSISKGITLMHLLYRDPKTRDLLRHFAVEYYQSETPLMVSKQLGQLTGGLIVAIVVALISDDPDVLPPMLAMSARGDLAEVAKVARGINQTLDELEQCQTIKAAKVDRLVVIGRQLRLWKAKRFYRKSGFRKDVVDKHTDGINPNHPVSRQTLQPGELVEQWQIPGDEQGNYYSYPGETPTRLGINPQGFDNITMQKVPKEVKTYRVIKKVKVLKSTAQKGKTDDWSVPDEPFITEGGAIQLMTTDKSAFEEVNQ